MFVCVCLCVCIRVFLHLCVCMYVCGKWDVHAVNADGINGNIQCIILVQCTSASHINYV